MCPLLTGPVRSEERVAGLRDCGEHCRTPVPALSGGRGSRPHGIAPQNLRIEARRDRPMMGREEPEAHPAATHDSDGVPHALRTAFLSQETLSPPAFRNVLWSRSLS